MTAEALKASILDHAAFTAALDRLKASAPRRQALAEIVKAVTGQTPLPDSNLRTLFRTLERFGSNERRRARLACADEQS